ncbi:MAG: flagellar hook-length control protein FliK [Ferrimicrobium sp.]
MSPVAKSASTPLLAVVPSRANATKSSGRKNARHSGGATKEGANFQQVQAHLHQQALRRQPLPTVPTTVPTAANEGGPAQATVREATLRTPTSRPKPSLAAIQPATPAPGAEMSLPATMVGDQRGQAARSIALAPSRPEPISLSSPASHPGSEGQTSSVPVPSTALRSHPGSEGQALAISNAVATAASEGAQGAAPVTAAPTKPSIVARPSHVPNAPVVDVNLMLAPTRSGAGNTAGVGQRAALRLGAQLSNQSPAIGALEHAQQSAPLATAPVMATTGEAVGSTPLGQLGAVVAQVVREGNLPRTITIALEPKDLGQLQLQVTSNGGEIQVHIQVADPSTRGMVSAQLPDLTNQLNRDLGFGEQHRGNQADQSKTSTPGPAVGVVSGHEVVPTPSVSHSMVDLRL